MTRKESDFIELYLKSLNNKDVSSIEVQNSFNVKDKNVEISKIETKLFVVVTFAFYNENDLEVATKTIYK